MLNFQFYRLSKDEKLEALYFLLYCLYGDLSFTDLLYEVCEDWSDFERFELENESDGLS